MSAARETLAGPAAFLLEVKKSRHLARAEPIETPEAALAFIARVSVPEATHKVWAYRIGAAYRFNDDGEPSGTAGKPVLAAIDGLEVRLRDARAGDSVSRGLTPVSGRGVRRHRTASSGMRAPMRQCAA